MTNKDRDYINCVIVYLLYIIIILSVSSSWTDKYPYSSYALVSQIDFKKKKKLLLLLLGYFVFNHMGAVRVCSCDKTREKIDSLNSEWEWNDEFYFGRMIGFLICF